MIRYHFSKTSALPANGLTVVCFKKLFLIIIQLFTVTFNLLYGYNLQSNRLLKIFSQLLGVGRLF